MISGEADDNWWMWPGRRAGVLALCAALLCLVLWMGNASAWAYALAGFALAALAAIWPIFIAVLQPRQGVTPALAPNRDAALLRGVIHGLPMPAALIDPQGRVLEMNTSVVRIAPALRLGEPALFALRNPGIVAALRRAIAEAAPQRAEYVERVPIERWFEVMVVPLDPEAGGRGSGRFILMIFNDLTPLRRVEEMRADFVANASHELRTPLASISGFIDTLKGPARNDREAQDRFLSIMQTQAARMARLIDDLLSLSRIELSAHVPPVQMLDVVAIVRQVVDGLEALAGERGVEMSVAADDDIPDIPGERDELFRLFENLIENALKYGASGGRVAVAIRTAQMAGDAREVRIAVRDFGPGIAPEHLPRLTERFYRVDVGESRAQGGTGLGLSLVKHILNRHRGRLTIESTPGNGATFTACLPARIAS